MASGSSNGDIQIKWGKLPSVTIFQVTEDELDKIELEWKNGPLEMTFATLFLSIGFGGMFSLEKSVFNWPIESWALFFVIIFLIFGIYYGIRGWRKMASGSGVIKKIRERINGDSEPPTPIESEDDL